MNLVVAFVAALCLSLVRVALSQTLLGPSPYLSVADSPFDSADPTFVLEDFEDDLFNVAGVSANLGNESVIGPGFNTDSVDADDGDIDGSGTFGHSFFGNGQTGITFTFDPAVLGGLPTQVGIVWTDGGGTVTFEAFAAGGASLGVVGPAAFADNSFFGETAEDRFFGVIHEGGVAQIKITNSSGGIEVDHLQFSLDECTPSPDINSDGHVDGADLGLLLGAWGGCPAGCCQGDLSPNGIVDGADLGLLLGAWTG